ncbi:MAG: MFS transporter [Devosia sp. 67-54]|uniref:MFS transporter n=1 Tax=unclassified Devosia TaxID=196773 RepID=UPI000868CC61|nr:MULTISPECIES: MFS transporter [unclassified Devosia]MBN9304917.1 MFS transporter [Devosia sp.]ODU56434.1 MAG: MFS transporter [Acetobacteraceae bacterium SCN 69-10]OJX15134.1 MAG: MFS transporter [Devosia sp. 67-54]
MRFGLTLPPHFRVFAAFAVYSFCMGSIFPRLPDIQHQMGVAEGALGLGLIGTPVGTLISLTFAAPLIEKLGFRRVLLGAIPLLAVLYAIAVHAPSPLVFFVLLVPVGLVIGVIEMIVNTEADRVEHQVGFRIMNRSHAFWSIGFFAAGLFGAWMAQLGISPQLHLMLVIPIGLVGVVLLLGRFEPAPHRAGGSTDAPPRFAAPTGAIMVLVAVTLSAMLLEGASMDWSAIYMRNIFNPGPFLTGVAVACFAFSQATTRFFADGFVEKHSPEIVARVLLVILLVGTLTVYFSPLPVLSLIGFALCGVGTSAIFPLAMSAAAQRTDRPAVINVAALAQNSFVIFLLGPPLLGGIAQAFGIRWSFGIGLPLIVLSFVLAGALGKKPVRAALPDPAPGE